jgi:hypothetical protein
MNRMLPVFCFVPIALTNFVLWGRTSDSYAPINQSTQSGSWTMLLIHPGAATTNARPRHRIRPEDTIRRHILAIKDRRLVRRSKEQKRRKICIAPRRFTSRP